MEKDIESALIGRCLSWEDNRFAPTDPRRNGSFIIGTVEGVGSPVQVYMIIDEDISRVEVLGKNVVEKLIEDGRFERDNTRIYTLED